VGYTDGGCYVLVATAESEDGLGNKKALLSDTPIENGTSRKQFDVTRVWEVKRRATDTTSRTARAKRVFYKMKNLFTADAVGLKTRRKSSVRRVDDRTQDSETRRRILNVPWADIVKNQEVYSRTKTLRRQQAGKGGKHGSDT